LTFQQGAYNNPLSLREDPLGPKRARVRGSFGFVVYRCPLIRPSATFSLREKGLEADKC